MKFYNQLFLQALKASLNGEKVQWNMEISGQEWSALLNQAQIHNVLPLIYEVVYRCPAMETLDIQIRNTFKKKVLYQVLHQTMKTDEFLKLQNALREAGFTPIVVKGIVCRNLYPKPDYRISADEDILIPEEQFAACRQALVEYGMYRLKPDQNEETSYEISYGKAGSPIYIELHRLLFSPGSEIFVDLNQYFSNVFEHVVCENVENDTVLTMDYTEHLFYLICHSFKHFLHSGFGIRQICDIILFANSYGCKIDWQKMLRWCTEIHAEKFSAALFKIGQNYLTFQPEQACYPRQWRDIEVDESALLEDLLDGGVYGNSNMSRKHSSNMTLNAVAAHKKGNKASGNVLRLVFPPVKYLEGQYPYLKKSPYLLPVAWVARLLKYKKETSQINNDNAMESIRIGNQRIELLRQYGVIDENEHRS